MTKFFISDTHFGHARIIELSNRPFNGIDHMDNMMIANWNRTVSPNDEVFHLGDVALGSWARWDGILTRLNGFKTLVVGNHDRVFKGMKQKEQDRFAEHYNKWFDVVTDEVKGFPLSDGTIVNMSHFPYDGDHTSDERFSEHRLPDEGRVLIHGHTHLDQKVSRSAKKRTLQIHVGADAWNYTPVSESEIVSLIAENA